MQRKFKLGAVVGAVAAALISLFGLSGVATASKGGPAVTSCTIALVPIGPASLDGTIPTVPVEQGCVPGQTQIDDVTGEPQLAAEDPTIGIIWDGRDFTGPSLSFTAPTGCLNGSYQVDRIGGGWNNRASSAAGLRNCDVMLRRTRITGHLVEQLDHATAWASRRSRASIGVR